MDRTSLRYGGIRPIAYLYAIYWMILNPSFCSDWMIRLTWS